GRQLVPGRKLEFDSFHAMLGHDHLLRGVRGRKWMLCQDAADKVGFLADEDGNQADVGFPTPCAANPSESMTSRTGLSVVHRPEPIAGVAAWITRYPFVAEQLLAQLRILFLLVCARFGCRRQAGPGEDRNEKRETDRQAGFP